MPFTDKIALVTGAASGIGEGVAKSLARSGAHVYAVDLAAIKDVQIGGLHFELRTLDVTDQTAWFSIIDEIRHRHGRLDILINSAGVIERGSIEETPWEAFQRTLEINLGGIY